MTTRELTGGVPKGKQVVMFGSATESIYNGKKIARGFPCFT
jgi:hypothetical protein